MSCRPAVSVPIRPTQLVSACAAVPDGSQYLKPRDLYHRSVAHVMGG
ncbi:hypothetical protein PF003_g11696 [Phytophthora fragariae]|nr:hypothetical protein PF003_g11696 [Phytophthora fragariae]